jgi:cell wall-associated NlpC family hydrolase
MKFSKFVKSSQSSKSSSSNGIYKKKSNTNTASSTLNTSSLMMAQQLLLTDDICRFQPQKNKLFLDEAATTTMTTNKISNASSNTENNYSSSYVTTPRINFTNLVTNINGSGSGKYLKSSQPKRLQRNRLQHVTSKPENYVLRSTLNLQSPSASPSMNMVS